MQLVFGEEAEFEGIEKGDEVFCGGQNLCAGCGGTRRCMRGGRVGGGRWMGNGGGEADAESFRSTGAFYLRRLGLCK